MDRQITITLNRVLHPAGADLDLIHRLRNFGEDLVREFRRSGQARISLEEIDAASSELHLQVTAKRHLGDVTAFIRNALRQHNLNDHFILLRGDLPLRL